MSKWIAKMGFDAYYGFFFGLAAVTAVLAIITII